MDSPTYTQCFCAVTLFITTGQPDSNQCAQNLATSIAVCHSLGLPLHPDKCIGLSTCLVVLGIELDSVAQVACLPADKLCVLKALFQSWCGRRCSRHELDPLIGHLHHAKVVWPGPPFLRQMVNLLQCFRKWDHPICLNSEFHLDLQWQCLFLVVSRHVWHVCLFRTDNKAVVYILNSRTSKVPVLMQLHVPGIHNCIADALSRFHWQEFRRLAPKAQLHPVSIPPQLLEELIDSP